MRKKLTIAGIVLAVLIIVAAVIVPVIIKNKPEENNELADISDIHIPVCTQEVEAEEIDDFEAIEPEMAQLDVLVDSWLQIIDIGETDGVLSVVVRNTADFDVEYALLSVYCNGEKLTFPMTTITAKSTCMLRTDTGARFDKDAAYVGWAVEEKTLFKQELSLYEDIFKIEACDGLISVKNISDTDIKGTVYVYYKTVENGVFTEGTTYRISIDGLDSDEKIQVRAEHYNALTSKVMFVTYVQ